MFELNTAISEWRRQMIAGGIKDPAVLDELESHLREDVNERTRSGISVQQAFEEAVRQVGNADALKQEFAKVTPPGPRLSFGFQRAVCIATALFVVLVETWTLFEYEMTRAERLFGLAVVWVSAAYISLFPHLNRSCWLGVRGLEIRNALGFVCGCIVPLWCLYLLLSTVNLVHLPSEIIYGVVFWSLVNVCWVTGLMLAYGINADIFKLWTPTALEAANSPVPKVLGRMGVSCETVRVEIEKIIGSGPKSQPTQSPPYTPRARKALALAVREAKALRCDRASTEHIFLGLLQERSGVAAVVLKNLGVNPENAREELLRACR